MTPKSQRFFFLPNCTRGIFATSTTSTSGSRKSENPGAGATYPSTDAGAETACTDGSGIIYKTTKRWRGGNRGEICSCANHTMGLPAVARRCGHRHSNTELFVAPHTPKPSFVAASGGPHSALNHGWPTARVRKTMPTHKSATNETLYVQANCLQIIPPQHVDGTNGAS